jgi:hypothetical protein
MAKFFGQDAPEDSPNFIISSQLRALIPQLDLEHYTASHAETSLLTFLTYAPEQVQVALNDPDVDRYPLVKQLVYTLGILDQDIVKGTPYPMLVEQIHMWLESLGTELAERAEDERYADDILAQAQQLVEQALTEPKTKRTRSKCQALRGRRARGFNILYLGRATARPDQKTRS